MMFHMEYLNNFMMLSSSIMLSFLLVPVLVLFVGFCIYCQYNRHDYSDRGHHFPVEKCGTDQARCSPIMQQGSVPNALSYLINNHNIIMPNTVFIIAKHIMLLAISAGRIPARVSYS